MMTSRMGMVMMTVLLDCGEMWKSGVCWVGCAGVCEGVAGAPNSAKFKGGNFFHLGQFLKSSIF